MQDLKQGELSVEEMIAAVKAVYPCIRVYERDGFWAALKSPIMSLHMCHAETEEECWRILYSKLPERAQAAVPADPLLDVYEVEAKDGGVDFTVFPHAQSEALLMAIWLRLDGLEDGESLKITYRKYTQEQLDEVYENE